jgi:hypothetical protein
MTTPVYPEIEGILAELKLPTEYKLGVSATILSVRELLHYLPGSEPSYTDHGVLHSQNLMRLLSNFLNNWTGTAFTNEEKYLLSLAVWLHDIGCLLGREKHNEKSVQLLNHPRFSFLDNFLNGDLKACLSNIIIAHASKYDLKKIPRTQINENVRLDLCCVTFRLIDGCDITDARTKPILYDILDSYHLISDESKPFWRCHLSTIGAVFDGNNINITYRKGKKTEASLLINHFKKDIRKMNTVFGKHGMIFAIKLRSSEF